ncbi:MAG: hypothetical protein FWG02_11590 [Holophagaceae bacterium]|nr:hypothetical protein [Holophagaceae bacterium]
MFIRLTLSLLFSTMINAQQRSIKLEFSSTSFPKENAFVVELKLHFAVIDGGKMLAEGRNRVTTKDYVFQQASTNTCNWAIAYDTDGNAIVTGSPQQMAFTFSKPVNLTAEKTLRVVLFEGKILHLKNGKVEVERPIKVQQQFQTDDTSFVFRLNRMETDKGVAIGHSILTKQQLQDILDGKSTTTTRPLPSNVNPTVSAPKKTTTTK